MRPLEKEASKRRRVMVRPWARGSCVKGPVPPNRAETHVLPLFQPVPSSQLRCPFQVGSASTPSSVRGYSQAATCLKAPMTFCSLGSRFPISPACPPFYRTEVGRRPKPLPRAPGGHAQRFLGQCLRRRLGRCGCQRGVSSAGLWPGTASAAAPGLWPRPRPHFPG